jgi:methyl-accepting chemotaxis protein
LCANAEAVTGDAALVSSALNDLIARADSDPKLAFEAFESSAKTLAKSSKSLENRLLVARTDAEKTFAEWSRNWAAIQDEDLKQESYERREKLSKAFAKAMSAMQPVVDESKQLATATKDVVTYLDQDLTPANIKSAESHAKAHAKSAKSIGEKVDDAVETTKEVSMLFATSKP